MARPSRIDEQRRRLLPRVAEAFARLGYRRATTSELARCCKVRENILYRLWEDKKEMFLAAIESLFQRRRDELEEAVRRSRGGTDRAEKMLAYVGRHFGDNPLARVIFAGLAETDDPEIRRCLARMYGNYREFLEREIRDHRRISGSRAPSGVEASALALIGLGTILNVLDELEAIPRKGREAFFARAFRQIGPLLLGEAKR